MSASSSSSPTVPFWKRSSTWLVTVIRLLLILWRWHTQGSDVHWLFQSYSSSVISILVKPKYTLSHVREALAIQQLVSGKKFGDAYVAPSRIQLSPLLLAILGPLARSTNGEIYMSLFCVLLDGFIAQMLESIAVLALFTNRIEAVTQETKEQEQLPEPIRPPQADVFAISPHTSSNDDDNDKNKNTENDNTPLISMESLPLLAARLYYWSPATILAGAWYGCFQMLPTSLLLFCLYETSRPRGSPVLSIVSLSLATYLEIHHVVYLVYVLLVLPKLLIQPKPSPNKNHNKDGTIPWIPILLLLFSFVVCLIGLQALSLSLLSSSSFSSSTVTPIQLFQATYGLNWKFLRPSLSVQWYFAIQLFSRFQSYFGALIWSFPYMVVIPLTIRLYRYPLVLVAIFSMLWTIFSPVQTLFDANWTLCCFLYCPRSLARMETLAFLSLCSIMVPILLIVVDHWMWMGGPNTGNANYIYFQCLAYNVFLGIFLGQFTSASLQRDKARRVSAKEREEEEEKCLVSRQQQQQQPEQQQQQPEQHQESSAT